MRDPNQRIRTAKGTATVAELEARCSIIEPGIVLLREPPHNNADTFEVVLDRTWQLGTQFDRWACLTDLSETTERPTGRYLQTIRRRCIAKLGQPGEPLHIAIVQPSSTFLRSVLGFVLGRMSEHATVHATRDAALKACRDALAVDQESVRER